MTGGGKKSKLRAMAFAMHGPMPQSGPKKKAMKKLQKQAKMVQTMSQQASPDYQPTIKYQPEYHRDANGQWVANYWRLTAKEIKERKRKLLQK